MLNRPVTTISARKRGTTRFLIGSTPSTWSASSSSRILRAPRSAVMAVPPTPARMIAVTNGANSRIEASTKKPPSRSMAPNRTRKLPAWSPGAPYPNAIVEMVSGSQQRRSMNRNCCTNSVPYGYGGRSAETSVLPVRIIMSPTCSSRFLVGKKTRSAALRTTGHTPPRRKPMACTVPPPEGTVVGQAPGRCPVRSHAFTGASPRSRWYVRAAVRAWRMHVVAVCLLALAGCGGERQDENEPEGDFPVEVVKASFPEKQKLAKSSDLVVSVRNAGNDTIPNIAITVNGLDVRKEDPDLADPSRPVFALNGVQVEIAGFPEAKDASPRGCDTAFVNTWACGPLKPNRQRTFRWSVTAVKAGSFKVDWRVAAGLDGKAKAVAAGGGPAPRGRFSGTISDEAPEVRVADDGKTIVTGTR